MWKLGVVILMVTLIALAHSDDSSDQYVKGCSKMVSKFDDIKSQHAMIKSMIADECKDDYQKMSEECYPILSKFVETKPDQAAIEAACKSDTWLELLVKHKKVWLCLKTLAEEFGYKDE